MVSSSGPAQIGKQTVSTTSSGAGSSTPSAGTASVQRALRGAPSFEAGAALLAPRPLQRKKKSGPDLADSTGPKKDQGAPLTEGGIWSGMLERMRAEDEFVQGSEKSYGKKTLWRACDRAFMTARPKLTRGAGGKKKGESKEAYEKRKAEWEKEKEARNSQSIEKQRTRFYQHVCNAQAFFFVQKAPELKRRERALGSDYATFKQFVEDELAAYLTSALSGKDKLVDADGYVLRTPGMDVDARVENGEKGKRNGDPYKMAQKLLGFEGRMVNIKAPGHFFPGEVKGGVLLARDNQNRRATGKEWRTGDYDLNEVQPDSTSGKTFKFLQRIEHITPATAPIPKDDESTGPASESAKPEAAPAPTTPDTPKPEEPKTTTTAFVPPKRGVTTDKLNLRDVPRVGDGSRKLRLLPNKKELVLMYEVQTDDAKDPKWYGANADGQTGYVAARYVRVLKDATPKEGGKPS